MKSDNGNKQRQQKTFSMRITLSCAYDDEKTTPTARPTEELPSDQITTTPLTHTLHSPQANTTTTTQT
jgi:hypothetical protein